MMRSSASRSRTESASTTQTYGEVAAFKPAFYRVRLAASRFFVNYQQPCVCIAPIQSA